MNHHIVPCRKLHTVQVIFNFLLFLCQGVVTAAISLITCLSQKNPDEFKTCVSLAVSRLSRVSIPANMCAYKI